MSIKDNFSNPSGLIGRMMLSGMNIGHTPLSIWALSQIHFEEDADILDVGCGGGINIKRMLKMAPKGHVSGLDISEDSVKKSISVNQSEIGKRCEIFEGSADEIPLADESFDCVTAFETIYFWKNILDCFKEVYRVLRPGGKFLIANDSGSTGWSSLIPGMKDYSVDEIHELMKLAGFETIYDHTDKTKICVVGTKGEKTDKIQLKPDYRNWVPKGMVYGFGAGALSLASVAALGLFGKKSGTKKVISSVLALGSAGLSAASMWIGYLHKQFSYEGERQLSKDIIEGVAKYIDIPEGGTGLDVGCGSGALTIATAKRNPNANIVGIDRWGKEYSSYSQKLCERNAKAEHVSNVTFKQGNALDLEFGDETFDSVFSNYVYHNITGADKQACLLETLRVLKKGGTFAIHDIMSKARYGDMDEFVEKLYSMGYENVKLIDTTHGKFMSYREAVVLGLSGSMLLVGKK